MQSTVMPTMDNHIIRLKPGDDLKESIQQYVQEKNLMAAWVTSCVGSLASYNIRFANQQEGNTATGHFEITSLSGTLSSNGSHLHISVSDSTGKLIGGHLLSGCKIYTTAEIVIQSTDQFHLTRETDSNTGFKELKIEKQ
jgi:uncharacterized protein